MIDSSLHILLVIGTGMVALAITCAIDQFIGYMLRRKT